ncbi:hypothetical protein BDV97DRAFT_349319 [Delphinella strobiligena]|nr:hypothetical protein BDV97DRAFT_349319 [Delphinella strobiligena]
MPSMIRRGRNLAITNTSFCKGVNLTHSGPKVTTIENEHRKEHVNRFIPILDYLQQAVSIRMT